MSSAREEKQKQVKDWKDILENLIFNKECIYEENIHIANKCMNIISVSWVIREM